jgi:hypothetical protein
MSLQKIAWVNRISKRFCSIAASVPKQDEEVSLERHPLMDKFNRFHTYLRISLTERCNLRCKLLKICGLIVFKVIGFC